MMILVFGSNLSGIHGAGAAAIAHKHYGAKWGIGEGLTGKCYAIPTKDKRIISRSLPEISQSVQKFIEYAYQTLDENTYKVTRIGCGLAGFKDSQIAPMFLDAPDNCFFDEKWKIYLPNKNFWGTF